MLTWQGLLVDTVRDPEKAGRDVMSVVMSRRDIWLGVIAAAALNTVFDGLLNILSGPPPPDLQNMPLINMPPLSKALIIAGLLVLLAHVLTWVGRVMGGQGQSDDLLKLMVWMQIVAVVLQTANIFLLLALPALGAIMVLVIVFILLRVLLNFIKVGHGFDSLGTAALVLFVSFIGMLVGLSVLLLMIGPETFGVFPNV